MIKNQILYVGVIIVSVVGTFVGWLWSWGLFIIFLPCRASAEEVTFVVTVATKAETQILY